LICLRQRTALLAELSFASVVGKVRKSTYVLLIIRALRQRTGRRAFCIGRGRGTIACNFVLELVVISGNDSGKNSCRDVISHFSVIFRLF
jgi:hypothetical protein